MKLRMLASLALLLTGVMVGALLRPAISPSSPPPLVSSPIALTTNANPASAPEIQVIRGTEPFEWRHLESTNFSTYVKNLRAIGCPEKTIHDIIRAEVDQLYEARHRALEPDESDHHEFWKPRREHGPADEFVRHMAHRDLEREKDALLRKLLGGEAGEPADAPPQPTNNGQFPLTADIREQVHLIQEKYHRLRDQVFHNAHGDIYLDDAATLQQLRDQRRTELGELLTPEQLRELDLRESPTAEHMRHDLLAFEPTESEFRAIFDVRQAYDNEFIEHDFDFDDPVYIEQREQAEAEMLDQIREILGDERFEEYELATNHRYRDLYRLGDRYELPQENINQMFDLWESSEQQVEAIHHDGSLTHEQRHQRLADLQEQVNEAGLQYLGENAFNNYRSRHGRWMEHLFER